MTALFLVLTMSASGLITHTALPLRITRGAVTTAATCSLIHREDLPGQVVLYCLTAGSLFRSSASKRPGAVSSVTVGTGEDSIRVGPDDVILSTASIADIALIRASIERSELTPGAVLLEPPRVNEPFVVRTFDTSGLAVDSAQRVRFSSDAFVIGDQIGSCVYGCLGAPAVTPRGLFGIVTECERENAPVITLVRAARSFLQRHVPALRVRPVT